MGYASCLEDNNDKVNDNRHMRGYYEPRSQPKPQPQPKPRFIVSPPLQPVLVKVVIPSPVRPDPETTANRERIMREKHVLALHELMPGSRWRR
jgi:hypothetical protein